VKLDAARKKQIEAAAKPLIDLITIGPTDRKLLAVGLSLVGSHLNPDLLFVLEEIAANNPPPLPPV
jgi:hypothetical protein